MKTISTSILGIFLLMSLISSGQNQGEAAPDFTLTQLSGGEFKLSEQNGKVVFIFWLGYDCPFCKSSAPSIQSEIISQFGNRNDFVAIGIDTWNGSSTQVNAFKSSTGLSVNYLLMGQALAGTYSTTYDRLAVIDKKGILTYKATGGTNSTLIANAKTAINNALQVATSSTSIEDNSFSLENYPNPFSEQTTIRFELEKTGLVQLDVFDISGKKVKEITRENYPAGEQQINFNKGSLESGLYFLRLKNDGLYSTHKMLIR